MNTKIMEGLAGARANMDIAKVPVKIFKEAQRKGDNETMERAAGYAGGFMERAEDYKTKAYEGMKEEAKETREKEKTERKKEIEKHREEKEIQQEKTVQDKDIKTDTVEISTEGMALLEAAQAEKNMGQAGYTENTGIFATLSQEL